MRSWVDEVETAVYPVVDYVPSIEAALIVEIALVLVIYVFDHRLETENKPWIYQYMNIRWLGWQ